MGVIWLPRCARGGRCRDSNRHDRSCSWPPSPHPFDRVRTLTAGYGRGAAQSSGHARWCYWPGDAPHWWSELCGHEILKDRAGPGRCRGAHHIAAIGCTLAKG